MNPIIDLLYKLDPFSTKLEISIQDIPQLYVPLEDLTGKKVESIVLEDFAKPKAGSFYALIGDSGSGKSSVLNFLLSTFSLAKGGRTLAIKLNEFPSEVNEPKDLLTHIIGKVYTSTSEFNKLTPGEKKEAQRLLSSEYAFTSSEREKASMGLKAWFTMIPALLGLEGSVGYELEQQSGATYKTESTVDDMISFTNQLVEIIRSKGKMDHVLIMMDETDKITKPGEYELSVSNAITFFGSVLPVLSKTNCSYLFVMNSQYDNEEFRKRVLEQYIDKVISIPRIPDIAGINRIIEKRTKAVDSKVELRAIWEEKALSALHDYYKEKSLRHFITACKFAVDKAWRNNSDSIMEVHTKDAILELK